MGMNDGSVRIKATKGLEPPDFGPPNSGMAIGRSPIFMTKLWEKCSQKSALVITFPKMSAKSKANTGKTPFYTRFIGTIIAYMFVNLGGST